METTKRRGGWSRRRWLGGGIAVIILAIITALIISTAQGRSQPQTAATVPVSRGSIVATIQGSGSIAAIKTLDQSFQTNGVVTEVLVEEGVVVKKGQTLARLDDRDLRLQIKEAQVGLHSAEARAAQAKAGNATPEDLEGAQASVANAQAQLEKARNGGLTAADIANAEAGVRSAQANLEKARTGNITAGDIENAEAAVRSAQANLEKARTGNVTAGDIANAEAAVRSAEAQLEKTRTGTTTVADIASAEAAIRSAEAQLAKARDSNVTPSDLASAEAALRSAEAQLQKAMAGPTPDQVSAAQSTLQQAQQSLEKTSAAASANKTSAEQSVAQAADSVRLAQESYSTAFWNNQQAEAGRNPATGNSFDEDKLDEDVQKRNYAEALRSAELMLSQEKSRLEQATITFENAKQQEINDVASAQSQVDNARVQLDELLKGPKPEDVTVAQSQVDQARASLEKLRAGGTAADIAVAQSGLDQARANLDKLRQPPTKADLAVAQAGVDQAKANLQKLRAGGTKADIAAAQASVDQAKANLQKLRAGGTKADIAAAQASVDQAQASLEKSRQGGTAEDIAASQAQVDQAQASLEKLTAPATATDLEIQSATVAQAEQALERARFNLEYATLVAPFDGVVTAVNIVPGSIVTSASAAVQLVDRSTMHINLRLSENDAVRARLGQVVTLTIDSLDGWSAEGEVSYIAPVAETTNDVVTYAVRVSFPDDDPAVKVGMTANVDVIVEQKDDVLLVPNSALLPKGAGRVVQVPNADGTIREVDVEVGLTDGSQTEVISGLNEGDQVIALPTSSTPRGGGPFGG